MTLFENVTGMIPGVNEAREAQVESQRHRTAEEKERKFAADQAALAMGQDEVPIDPIAEKSDLLRWQQDLSDEEEQLVHDLKNEFFDGTTWKQLPDTRPFLNPSGINMLLTEARPLMNRNIMMSNFTEKRILLMLKDTCNTVVDNLTNNFDQYKVQFSNLSHIVRLFKNYIIPAPYRAVNNGERRYVTTTNKRVEAYTENGKENVPKNPFGFIK